jgi:hypothetical protein
MQKLADQSVDMSRQKEKLEIDAFTEHEDGSDSD